jgi:type IV pilus assembly protein PilZ
MGDDQREHERIPTDFLVRVRFPTKESEQEASCRNLSLGGLFIEMKEPPGQGTPVKMEIQLDPVGQTVYAEGVVAWTRPEMPDQQFPAGMGIKFTRLGEDAQLYVLLTVEYRKRRLAHPRNP